MVEDEKEPQITSDDMSTLRILLHTIKGISPVSTTMTSFLPDEEESSDEN